MRTLNTILDGIIATLRNTVVVHNGYRSKVNTEPVTKALEKHHEMRELGQGHFSIVFSCPEYNHLAIKVGLGEDHKGTPLTDDWLRFGLYCMQNPASHLPEIHRLHVDDAFYIAVVEQYKPFYGCATKDQSLWRKSFMYGAWGYWPQWEDDFRTGNPELIRAFDLGVQLQAAFPNAEVDMHEGNFMLGEDGRVICTDPFSFQRNSKEELVKKLQHSNVKEITCSVTGSASRKRNAKDTSNSAVRGHPGMMAKSPLGEMRYMVRAMWNDLALFGRAVVHVKKAGTKTKHLRVCIQLQQAAHGEAMMHALEHNMQRAGLHKVDHDCRTIQHSQLPLAEELLKAPMMQPVRFVPRGRTGDRFFARAGKQPVLFVDECEKIAGAADLQKWANVDFAQVEQRVMAHMMPRRQHDQFIETRPFQGFLARHGQEPFHRPVSPGPVLRSG